MMPDHNAGSVKNLTKTCQYQRVYRKGRLYKGELLWAYVLPVPGGTTRTGVSISARIIKKATERNRLKRIIKNYFLQNYLCGAGSSYEIVIVAKQATALDKRGCSAVRRELPRLLEQACSR